MADPINSEKPVKETRSQEHHKEAGRNRQPVRTSPRLISAALIFCMSCIIYIYDEAALNKETRKLFEHYLTTHQM
jgi:hypothetical protein